MNECEEILGEFGRSTESAAWRGPQVIIPTSLQAASNCIVTDEHGKARIQKGKVELWAEIGAEMDEILLRSFLKALTRPPQDADWDIQKQADMERALFKVSG